MELIVTEIKTSWIFHSAKCGFSLLSLKSPSKGQGCLTKQQTVKYTNPKIAVSVIQEKCYNFFGTITLLKSYLHHHPFILPSFHVTSPIISSYLGFDFCYSSLVDSLSISLPNFSNWITGMHVPDKRITFYLIRYYTSLV